ncbi:MAG TPA: hypothetical protein VGJ20_16550 [Xanthobacteraceae bacterium]
MAILVRVLMIIVGYFLACAAAALVLTIGTVTPEWDEVTSLGLQSAALWSVVAVGAATIAVVAMLPWLLVVALAEGFAWRSVVVYGVLGGAVALALSYGLDLAGYVGDVDRYLAHEREVLAASGIAGGLVYWLFAGRKAGCWNR